jgi:hypothetical protein
VLQNQFGETLQMRSGLVVMPLEKTNTYLHDTTPVLIWNRDSAMVASWYYNRAPGSVAELSSIVSQLILAQETTTLMFNLTSNGKKLAFTELDCRFEAPNRIGATSTSLVISSTTAASPKGASPSSTSGTQTAAAAGVAVAATAFLIVLFIINRIRRRNALALDELAPPVPQYIISQVSFGSGILTTILTTWDLVLCQRQFNNVVSLLRWFTFSPMSSPF